MDIYDLCDFSITLSSLAIAVCFVRMMVRDYLAELASRRLKKRNWQVSVNDSTGGLVRTLQVTGEFAGRLIKVVDEDRLA